jgi:tetratricopeptide (TPR) repeat protein
MSPKEQGHRYYRLGLGAAKRRDLSAALAYAEFARFLSPAHEGAARLTELCRLELEEPESSLNQIALLAGQKKWKAAALAAKDVSCQSVRLLTIQGCLWALAKRYGPAMDCFAKALEKDRGNILAAKALAELGRRRRFLGGFFCSSLILIK